MTDYLSAVQNVFYDVLGEQDLELTPETLLKDIPHCDSVALIQIVLMIENQWGINFETDEVAELRSIGQIANLIEKYT
ncbi:MAG: acyl carrier protein [Planctomycetaceae bacterium]|jgi:acyl carrier protein|nr:acyl carrier protein [Planctomycetaceae bacterium]